MRRPDGHGYGSGYGGYGYGYGSGYGLGYARDNGHCYAQIEVQHAPA